MNPRLRIVFMGTPDFALPALKALDLHHDVVAVVTNPDRPKGRGGKMTPPPVKEYAESRNIDCLQPESVKTDGIFNTLSSYDADLFVTCAYGKILPERILNIPKSGCINIHASLLPKYRGSAPIWHCIINGESETGITTMMTDKGMDTGDMLLKRTVKIPLDMTMGELHDILSVTGSELIIETIDKLIDGTLVRMPQNNDEATYAPMINRDTGKIDWNKTAFEIHNLVRGVNPFPGAFAFIDDRKLKIWKTEIADCDRKGNIGEIIDLDASGALVKTGKGCIRIIEVQGENSKRMHVWNYHNGNPVPQGTLLK